MPASWQSLNLLNGCQLLGAIKPQTLSPTKAQGPAASVVVSETGKGLFLQGSYYVWCAALTQYVFLIYTVVVVVVVVSSWWWWRRWCWWWSGGCGGGGGGGGGGSGGRRVSVCVCEHESVSESMTQMRERERKEKGQMG